MKNTFYMKGLRLWLQGLLLLGLRWAQLKSGFDPDTGLSSRSIPGMVLPAVILICAAVELYLCTGLPGGKRTYLNCMWPMEQRQLPILAAGSLLLCVGAVLLPGWGPLSAAAAAASAAAAVGFILFTKLLRNGAKPKVYYLLPSMVFSVLFVLVIYLPEEGNPVLARYYLTVLAAALTACAFYQLAGMTCREGKLRWFVFFGDLAVPLCLAAMADCAESLDRMLIYFGFALVLTVFLLTRREEVLPEPIPEPEKEDGEAAAEPVQE